MITGGSLHSLPVLYKKIGYSQNIHIFGKVFVYTGLRKKYKGDFVMKKCLSIFLAALLMFSVFAVSASAEAFEYPVELPVVNIRGNAEEIYDEDGVLVYDFDPSADAVKDCAKRVLPLLLKGFVTNDFDEYYRAFGEEMAKIYYHCQLDGNGNPQWGTGVSKEKKAENETALAEVAPDENGKFSAHGLTYHFDWRLDPWETVDGLAEYIDRILEKTGKDKINLYCNCLGGELLLAYTAKYGTDKLNSLCYTEVVSFGSELVDDTFSAHFQLDADAAERFAGDDFLASEMKGKQTLRTFLEESLFLAKQTGAFDRLSKTFMDKLYSRLYEGLAPELCLATFGTWPGYWTMVTKEHYAETRDFIFGQPGSERYEEYAGLIQKLDRWDTNVRQHIPELLQSGLDNGTKLGITVRYGFQFPPILESNNINGDVWVSAKNASLGATVADIGTTLSDDYIAERTAAGFGKYISPDKQIDASTCAFPEYTWFIKGAVHNDRNIRNTTAFWQEFMDFDGIPTVDDLNSDTWARFMVAVPTGEGEGKLQAPMTEENMNTETYTVTPPEKKEKTIFEKIMYYLEHLLTWFRLVLSFLKK